MHQIWKRFLSMALAVTIVMSLMPRLALPAKAADDNIVVPQELSGYTEGERVLTTGMYYLSDHYTVIATPYKTTLTGVDKASSMALVIEGDVVIDLCGHTLTCQGANGVYLKKQWTSIPRDDIIKPSTPGIYIKPGGSLIIVDSGGGGTVAAKGGNGTPAGNGGDTSYYQDFTSSALSKSDWISDDKGTATSVTIKLRPGGYGGAGGGGGAAAIGGFGGNGGLRTPDVGERGTRDQTVPGGIVGDFGKNFGDFGGDFIYVGNSSYNTGTFHALYTVNPNSPRSHDGTSVFNHAKLRLTTVDYGAISQDGEEGGEFYGFVAVIGTNTNLTLVGGTGGTAGAAGKSTLRSGTAVAIDDYEKITSGSNTYEYLNYSISGAVGGGGGGGGYDGAPIGSGGGGGGGGAPGNGDSIGWRYYKYDSAMIHSLTSDKLSEQDRCYGDINGGSYGGSGKTSGGKSTGNTYPNMRSLPDNNLYITTNYTYGGAGGGRSTNASSYRFTTAGSINGNSTATNACIDNSGNALGEAVSPFKREIALSGGARTYIRNMRIAIGGNKADFDSTIPTGYTCGGFFTSDGTKVLNADGSCVEGSVPGWVEEGVWINGSPSADLIADVVPVTYTVAFDKNADSATAGSISSLTKTYQSTLQLPSAGDSIPTRTGYTFKGWATRPDATAAQYTIGLSTDLSTTQDDTVTLYAVWEAKSITHYVYPDGGTFTDPVSKKTISGSGYTSTSVKYNQQYSWIFDGYGLQIPTRTGYTFAGWYRGNSLASAQSSSTKVTDGTVNTATTTSYLAAHWTEHQYTVKYNANGGSGSMASSTHKYSEVYNLAQNQFTRTGYNFKGWATSAGGSVVHTDQKSVSKLSSTNNATVNLYAVWEAKSYTQYVYPNGGSFTDPVSGTTVSGNGRSTTSGTYGKAYSTIFGGKGLPTPTREGYTFAGWYRSTNLSTAQSGGTKITNSSTMNQTSTGYIVAHWTEHQYTVEYDKNHADATGTMASSVKKYSEVFNLAQNRFSRTGYKFLGWATSSTGSMVHTDQKQVSKLTATNNGTVRLYAKWAGNTYTVNFDKNATSATAGTTMSLTKTYGTNLTLPKTGSGAPTRTGYTFKGWATTAGATAAAYTTTLSTDLTTTEGSSVTLYAVWAANTYTHYVYPNGGSFFDPSSQVTISGNNHCGTSVEYDAKYSTSFNGNGLPTPSRTGYTFAGWFRSNSQTGAEIGGTRVTNDTVNTTPSLQYLAPHWTANKYTVKYNINCTTGGSGTMTNTSATYDTAFDLPENQFHRIGYTFLGWSTNANATTADYIDGQTGVKNLATSGTLNLYAVWQANTYTVTFSYVGVDNTSFLEMSRSVTYGQPYGSLPQPTREGYTLKGWSTDAAGTKMVTATTPVSMALNHTLYTQWQGEEVTVTLDPNDGTTQGFPTMTAIYGSTYGADLPETMTRAHYTFLGWYTAKTGGQQVLPSTVVGNYEDHTLYAHWQGDQVSFVYNYEKATGNNTTLTGKATYGSTFGALVTPIRTGYTFGGWWTAPNGGGDCIKADTIVTQTADFPIYAKWTANQYTVTFDGNDDGTNTAQVGTASKQVTYDGSYGTLPEPTRAGYIFQGWAVGNSFGSAVVTESTKMTTAKAHTLYALWQAETSGFVLYPNGGQFTVPGTGNVISGAETASTEVDTDEKYATMFDNQGLPTVCSRTGYDFAGWYRGSSVNDAMNGADAVTNDTVNTAESGRYIAAHWTPHTYTIAFNANQGEGTMGSMSATYDASANLSKNQFTRTGYTFLGWSKDQSASTADYADAGEVQNLTAEDGATVTLYAIWEANEYTVTFEPNGENSEVITDSKTVTYDSTYGDLPTPTRTGYTFAGWYTAADSGSEVTAGSAVAITADQTLYAHWTANEYTVTYVYHGADGAADEQTKSVVYDSVYGAISAPTRTGYTFAGWHFDETGDSAEVTADTVVRIAEDHELHAHWTANHYSITFDPNNGDYLGGENETVQVSFTYDDTYAAMPTPVRKGYLFQGWFDTFKETGGTEYKPTDTVKITNDALTLYARWSVNTYQVTLDTNGGTLSGEGTKTSVVFGQVYPRLPTPVRTGYTFQGWFDRADDNDTDGEGNPIIGNQIHGNETKLDIDHDHTLYARWSANTYQVSFQCDGGTVSQETKDVVFDAAYGTLPVPDKTGYHFVGWYLQDGSTAVTDETLVGTAGNHDLYAHWEANQYTVQLDSKGGVLENYTVQVTYGGTYADLPDPTRIGYRFLGWYDAESDGNLVNDQTPVTITQTQQLYAAWEANKYTVTFDVNSGDPLKNDSLEVTYDAAYGTLPAPNKTGYEFAGWFTAAEDGDQITAESNVEITAEQTLYAHWTARTYSVMLDVNGGDAVDSSMVDVVFDAAYPELPEPTRAGYTFAGWRLITGAGSTDITAGTQVSFAGDHTLTAIWTANTYSVAMDVNGGSPLEPATISVTYDEVFSNLPTPIWTGRTFLGWYTEAENGELVNGETVVKITDNTSTLYAHWQTNVYTVLLNANGGTAAEGAETSVSKTYATAAALPMSGYTREGYTFQGWAQSADGEAAYANSLTDDLTEVAGEEVSLYAVWQANEYQVTFDYQDADGGEMSETTRTVTFGSAYGSLPVPQKSNYEFGGWYTQANGAGVEVTAESLVTIADNHTLYADWIGEDLKVVFEAPNGVIENSESEDKSFKVVMYHYGDLYWPYLPVATRTGYEFVGWYTDRENGTVIGESDRVAQTGELKLYAHWTPKTYEVTLDPNQGDALTDNKVTLTYDEPYSQVTLPTPTRTGYQFTGWYLSTADDAVRVDGDETVNVKTAEDHTLYAHWSAKSIAVTFDYLNGDAPDGFGDTAEFTFDGNYDPLPIPTRTGYLFAGWYTLPVEGDLINTGTRVTNPEAHTLYARWTAIKYTVTFDYGVAGSGYTPESMEIFYDAYYSGLPTPARTGYDFLGWFTAGDDAVQVTEGQKMTTARNHTLDAHWEAKSIFVSFDANGGEVSETKRQVEFDGQYGLMPTPTRTGYDFVGWFTEPTGGTLIGATDKVSTITDITLYAHWTPKTYTVTYDYQDGTVDDTRDTQKTVTYGAAYGDLPSPVRTGYDFAGWYDAQISGNPVTAESTVQTARGHTLYARWTAHTLTVKLVDSASSFEPYTITVTYDQPYNLSLPARDGYAFDGWWTFPIKAMGTQIQSSDIVKLDKMNVQDDAHQTLYALWVESSIEVTFDYAGADSGNTVPKAGVQFGKPYGILPTPTKVGYQFAGWYTKENGQGTKIEADTPVTNANSHTLYAHWVASGSVVTFQKMGGSTVPGTTEMTSKSVIYGQKYGELPQVQKTGYDFLGWFTTESVGGMQITAETTVTNPSSHDLYARWKAKEVIVTLDYQDSATADGSVTVSYGAQYGTLPSAERNGYTFVGWFTEPNGQGDQIMPYTTVTKEQAHTLYAFWSEKTFTVHLEYQDGAEDHNTTQIIVVNGGTYGGLPTDPERTGYTFAGWYTASIGGTLVETTTKVELTADQNLYAHWTANSYQVSFSCAGETIEAQNVTFGEKYGMLPTPANAENFAGWYTSEADDAVMVTADTVVSTAEDHTLYARWNQSNEIRVTLDAQGGTVDPTFLIIKLLEEAAVNEEAFAQLLSVAAPDDDSSIEELLIEESADESQTEPPVEEASEEEQLPVESPEDESTAAIPDEVGDENLDILLQEESSPDTFSEANGIVKYPALPTPVREGYQFLGWYTAAEGGTQISEGAEVTNLTDHALYAHWQAESISVTLDYQWDGKQETITVQYDGKYTSLPANPTRNGYTFAGWYTSADASGALVTTDTQVKTTTAHTLYAHWTAGGYTINYDANGGTGALLPTTASYDTAVTLNTNRNGSGAFMTRTGHVFLGWSLNQNASTAEYRDQAMVTNLSTPGGAGSVTLYAVWAAISSPGAVTVTEGQEARFTTSVSDAAATYQWQSSSDFGGTWSNITGATGKVYKIDVTTSGDDTHLFRCVVTIGGFSGVSAQAVLRVNKLDSNKAIIRFNLGENYTSYIDEHSGTITVFVPKGTVVTSMTPIITLSTGATVSPQSGVAQDFTSSVTYTVTADDGSKKTYTVTVMEGDSSYHIINIQQAEGGQVTTNTPAAATNTEIVLTVTPKKGYELKTLTVAGSAVTASPVEDVNGDISYYTYTFNMPDKNVSVQVSYIRVGLNISGRVSSWNPTRETTITLYQSGTPRDARAAVMQVTIPGIQAIGQSAEAYTLEGVRFGTYDMVVTKDAHTSYTITGLTVTEAMPDLTLPTIELYVGDLNSNGTVDSVDMSILLRSENFGRSVRDAVLPIADLNGSSIIDSVDLSVMLQSQYFGKRSKIVSYSDFASGKI